MRIISGTHKGKRLVAPRNLPIRPTTDFAKESLFNIINNYYDISELSVIDLYAGMGSISFEFLSRGASYVLAVDHNHKCLKYIKTTASQLSLKINTIKSDVFKYLSSSSVEADIIFADPPYDIKEDILYKIPELIFSKKMIRENGILILEHSKHKNLKFCKKFSFERRYGSCTFSFFEA